jgi:hypothetical protein
MWRTIGALLKQSGYHQAMKTADPNPRDFCRHVGLW